MRVTLTAAAIHLRCQSSGISYLRCFTLYNKFVRTGIVDERQNVDQKIYPFSQLGAS